MNTNGCNLGGRFRVSQGPTLVAKYPIKAKVAEKWVELKRRGGEEPGIGLILMLMLWMEKSKGLIFVMFHVLFVYSGSWKLEKIEAFDFCEVLCTWGHEIWRKLKHLIFVKFRVLGFMKFGENWSIWFLWSFLYLGSWKLEKIQAFDFLWSFMYKGSWKFQKIEAFYLCEVLCTRGHENRRKLNNLNFVNFVYPGHENRRKLKYLIFLKFSLVFMTTKLTKFKFFNFLLIFSHFHDPRVQK